METLFGPLALALLAAIAAAVLLRSPRQTVIVVSPTEGYEPAGSGCFMFVVLVIVALVILSIASCGAQ